MLPQEMTSSLSNYSRLALLLLFYGFVSFPCFAQVKIYIQPDNGFETYTSAALTKKHVPAVVVSEEDAATFILQPTPVDVKTESTGSKVARCLFLYCAGIQGEQTVSIQLFNPRTKASVWAYTVRKYDASAYQSSAEAIAKHLKQFLEEHKELIISDPSSNPLGVVFVVSNPNGAEIYVDDAFVSKAPATLNLKPGQHYVRAFMNDYKNWSRQVTITAGTEAHLTVTLEKSN